MATVVITRGLPASGKSTWARAHVEAHDGWVRVNKDDLRAMLHNGKWSKGREKQVISMRDAMIRNALAANLNVIVDDTNFHPSHIEQICKIAKEFGGVSVEIKEFDVPVDECIERDAKRPNPVGAKVIRNMHAQYVRPKMTVEQNPCLPKAIIVDMDGTLAIITDRSPYEDDKADQDLLNHIVAEVVLHYAYAADVEVIIVSGRDEGRSREATERWLTRHQIPFDHLYMRKAGDVRKDSIVKREIFDTYIKDRFYVKAVFDDRDQVVRMWRDMGLQVFQVADGNF